ncbi:TolC family protein [Azohydromonas aeria]|uniref:TolC family protein n=1 Tax=Azohydromonas aeria TaxID=2590212 RepID=UPI0012F99559|nr:TolC family protein [Azohydromonas aeria]
MKLLSSSSTKAGCGGKPPRAAAVLGLVALAWAWAGMPAQAQTQAQTQADTPAPVRITVTASSLAGVYTLRAAVADALARSPAVAAAGSERVTAGYLREGAEWARYPTLSAEVVPGRSSSQSGSNSRLLRLDQPLWSGGRISGAIDLARAQEAAARLGESEARRNTEEQTAVAYLGWSGAQERLRIADDGRAVFERLLAYVERREQAGAAAKSDVSAAQARLASVGVQREQLAAELERSRSELRALVVGPVAGAPQALEVPASALRDADSAEAEYLARSNVAAQREADIEAAQAAAAVRRGESLPRLSLRLERQDGTAGGVPGDTRAMLALSFTPEAGLGSLSSIQAAQSRITTAQDQARVAEQEIRLRARAHLTEEQSARRQIAGLVPQIESLQYTADSYMRQFEAGRRTWIEVLNIFREVLDTRVALSRARTQHAQGALRLMGNTGALSPWIETNP